MHDALFSVAAPQFWVSLGLFSLDIVFTSWGIKAYQGKLISLALLLKELYIALNVIV
jgi:hypothetical protein